MVHLTSPKSRSTRRSIMERYTGGTLSEKLTSTVMTRRSLSTVALVTLAEPSIFSGAPQSDRSGNISSKFT